MHVYLYFMNKTSYIIAFAFFSQGISDFYILATTITSYCSSIYQSSKSSEQTDLENLYSTFSWITCLLINIQSIGYWWQDPHYGFLWYCSVISKNIVVTRLAVMSKYNTLLASHVVLEVNHSFIFIVKVAQFN